MTATGRERLGRLTVGDVLRLREALSADGYSDCAGATHSFYHYPARFSPDVARTVIELFSEPGDVVLDPFMGGGTSIIEGLCLGRQMVGLDLNALAHFVSDVRTTPLSLNDESVITEWADEIARDFSSGDVVDVERPWIPNLPPPVESFLSIALRRSDVLPFPRQRAFARCALLRLGQKALDCRDYSAPRRRKLASKLPGLVREMFGGLSQFVESCRTAGLAKNAIAGNRLLLHRNAIGMQLDPRFATLGAKPRLVVTSPPYPQVHVLYHRWQYRGRKETAAPYWIARVPDGFYESYYTGGSRTPTGQRRYFDMIEGAFRSVREVMDPAGMVVQLVGFAAVDEQLPLYMEAMNAAGFDDASIPVTLDRRVPHRKWYAKLQGAVDASCEYLLLHRPRRSRQRN